ncbi:MAG: hypothetical protein H0Z33_06380 [Bacillaceae bacterium]|nr:hypothetical protein [Bacillaceae bacterium]
MTRRQWYRIKEYQTRQGVQLSEQSVQLLHNHFRQVVKVRKAADGSWDIKANSIVGHINLPDAIIQIEPKIPIQTLWEWMAWAYDLKSLEIYPSMSPFQHHVGDQEWLVKIFLYECEKIYSQGIYKGYVTREEALGHVRGQLNAYPTFRLWLQNDYQFLCTFDELTYGVTENEIIFAGLQDMSSKTFQDPEVKSRIHKLIHVFGAEFSTTPKRSPQEWIDMIDSIKITRLNHHYTRAFRLLRLYWEAAGLSFQKGNIQCHSFLLDMNELFERYIAKRLQHELSPYHVNVIAQKQDWLAVGGRIKIVPDLIIKDASGDEIVLDTKYIGKTEESSINSHIFQMLAYLTARQSKKGILLYVFGPEREDVIKNTDMVIYQWGFMDNEFKEDGKALTDKIMGLFNKHLSHSS